MFNHRVTPQSTTTKSPVELLFCWKLKSRLDLLPPDLQGKVESKVEKQKESHDRHVRFREFKEDDTVFVRYYRTDPKWIEGTVCERLWSVSYIVKVKNGVELRRHIDQLRERTSLSIVWNRRIRHLIWWFSWSYIWESYCGCASSIITNSRTKKVY